MDLGKLLQSAAAAYIPGAALINKAITGEYMPGINVGEVISAATGQKSWDEADILDDTSVAGGVRNPAEGQFIGTTVYPTTEKTQADSSTVDNSVANGQTDYSINNSYSNNTTTSAEKASYQDIIDNLSKLLGYSATKREQGVKSISDEFANTQALQNKTYDTQKLQNVQNKEKGYNEVGNFANTSYNNLKRLLQGANAGRSSVGQVLAPYMVGRSADTRRKAVTDTAGENERNIDTAQADSNQSISNQKLKSLQDFENSMLGTMNDLESQKRTAQLSYDMANGLNYGQARDKAANLTSNINNRYLELSNLFNKYKPNYEIKEAPALSTYQVDPAQIKANQNNPSGSDFYLNQLKRKKELGL